MKSNKKIIIGILIFSIVLLVGWMTYSSITTLKAKKEITSRISTIPEFHFLSQDSLYISVKTIIKKGPLLILYFNSECEYCRAEVLDIVENKHELGNIKLLLISLEEIKTITEFADKTGLLELPNVVLGKIDDKTADEILWITSTPQLFIYNKEGKLTKKFKGVAKIEAIIKYANQI